MTQEKIERINELTAISRTRELTPPEQAEREALRREYIDSFKNNLEHHLKNIKIVDK